MNSYFSGKSLKFGTIRERRRDDLIEKDVMRKIWKEGVGYIPTTNKDHYVAANWYFSILAVMYDINFFGMI